VRRVRHWLALTLGLAVACVLAAEGVLLFRNWSPPGQPAAQATWAAATQTTGAAAPATPARHPATPARHPATQPATRPLLSPFTGQPVPSLGPVLAVPVDNAAAARPQAGLRQADIVYVLPAEGGLSRFLAVYSSRVPRVTGPVYSAHADDLQLLRQFGRPAFAYSGAPPPLLPVIQQARIVGLPGGAASDVPGGATGGGPRGYFPDPGRPAPDNMYARTRQLLAAAHGASTARDIGFRFGPVPAGGLPTAAWSVSYPAASFSFSWSAPVGRWLVGMDGAAATGPRGRQLSAATVVIQYTTIGVSRFAGVTGPAPFAYSTGAGRAVVLRNGQSWQVRWFRSHGSSGTTFTTDSGQRMTFARGPVWVILTQP
jgi:hypothetical protein